MLNAPIITWQDGGDTASTSVATGTTSVATLTATSVLEASWEIVGGADADFFTIDPATGELAFMSAPDAAAPGDSDGDNVYEVVVSYIAISGLFDDQTISVTVLEGDSSSGGGTGDPAETVGAGSIGGEPNAILSQGLEDTDYIVSADELLAGFFGDDGEVLSVANLVADFGNVTDNGDGTFTITPDIDFFGQVTLTYDVVSDDGDVLEGQTQIFEVLPEGDTGSSSGEALVLEDGEEDIDYVVSAGQLLAVVAEDTTGLAVINLSADFGTVSDNGDGTFTITPDQDFNGLLTLTYDVDDGSEEPITGYIAELNVLPVNDAPTEIALSGAAVDENSEGGTVIGTVSAMDPEGDEITYELSDDAGGLFELVGDTLQVKEGAGIDYETATSHEITLTATDSEGLSSSQTFTIEVTNVAGANITGTAGADVVNETSTAQGQPHPTAEEDLIRGLGGNDVLVGLAGNDTIEGGAGNDTLNGGGGSDRLAGGTGDDVYVVSDRNDTIVENASEGTDRVHTSLASFTLEGITNVENLTFFGFNPTGFNGTGNAHNNAISGAAGNDTLSGGAGDDILSGGQGRDIMRGGLGNDLLNGGAGIDTMAGGAGSDVYVVDAGDIVVEATTTGADAGGIDLVNATASFTLAAFVEDLTLAGTAAIDGTGNRLANTITGNVGANLLAGQDGNDTLLGGSGVDTLRGGAGNDVLVGGVGADELTGGVGKDRFVFNAGLQSGVDRITDFSVVDDTILLASDVFAAAKVNSAGALLASNFVVGTRATTVDQHVIYNAATGAIIYDADGSGAGAARQIATVAPNLALTAADFVIV